MVASKNKKRVRDMSPEEILTKISELREKIRESRFVLGKPGAISETRREIARLLTELKKRPGSEKKND